MFRRLKPWIKRYSPLACAYRTMRDAWIMHQSKPQASPYGFMLMGNSTMQAGTFEPEETALVQHYFDQLDVFIDVGANIGFYTCLARSAGKHTIAIEPDAQNLHYLYANLIENGYRDVEVYPVGLACLPGLATLYGANTGASLINGWASTSQLPGRTIPVCTLDILVGERFSEKLLMIKVDVEGAEYDLLQGAVKTLALSPSPIWLVEICLTEHHPSGINPNYAKTFEMFWRSGYEARTANQDNRLVLPADVEQWINVRTCEFGSVNYLFMRKQS